MGITILLGLACAISRGLPDISLARAVRTVGIVPTVIGSVLIGLVATAPLLLWAGPLPDPTLRGVLLVVLAGGLTLAGYMTAFSAFKVGKVSVVAPIIACEGAVAAVAAILFFSERLEPLILLFLPIAAVGVVLAAMSGDGEGRGGVLRASAAALVWGGILLTAAPWPWPGSSPRSSRRSRRSPGWSCSRSACGRASGPASCSSWSRSPRSRRPVPPRASQQSQSIPCQSRMWFSMCGGITSAG